MQDIEKVEKKDKKKSKKKRNIILIILLLLLLLLLFLLCFLGKGAGYGTFRPEDKISFLYDDNATDGDITGKSKDDIVAALNEKVAEGDVNIHINGNPIFADGTAKGTLMIKNSEVNRYPQQIEIYVRDTNELIYSGGVAVGQKIETSTLLVDLPKGDYNCRAYFHAIDLETGDRLAPVGVEIVITVLS